MITFKNLSSNNKTNSLYIQGSRAEDTANDIASLVFQNYDDDTQTIYKMAELAMRDAFGTAESNGIGNLIFRTNPTGASNMLEQARLTYDGNFLIGTSNSIDKLTVAGSAFITNTITASNIKLINQLLASSNDSVTAPGYSWANDSNTGLYHPLDNTLAIVTDSNERLRVTSVGNIAINTTTAKERLEVIGNVLATNVQKITKTTDSLSNLDIQLNWQFVPTSNQYYIVLETYQEVANNDQQGVRYQRHTISTYNAAIISQQTAQIWGSNTPATSLSITGTFLSPSNIRIQSTTNWVTTDYTQHSFCLNTVLVPETSNLGQVWLS
jgi:hypothetical protein